ncbi:hypothetical protein TWF506_002038 [Arthrobotrys conoides]|uniref:Protein kinase domain-containing protein n=1 Tax=Arthrobotrys conoides TaxID=74498 RepID=A0AAN8RYK1_9PEZI
MSDQSQHVFPFSKVEDFESLSDEEIIHAVKSKSAPYLDPENPTRIRRLSKNVLVKYGGEVLPSEAEALKLVATMTRIRVPRVYKAIFRKTESTMFGIEGYIVMEHLPGTTLASLWDTYDKPQQERVCAKIWDAILQLRQLKIDRSGPIGGGIAQGVLFTLYGAGPFDSPKALEDWHSHKLDVCKRLKRIPHDIPNFTGKFRPPFCLTHLDLAARNILVDANGDIALIDWGFAGAYPPWFEIRSFGMIDYTNPWSYRAMMKEIMAGEYEEEVRQLEAIHFALFSAPFL